MLLGNSLHSQVAIQGSGIHHQTIKAMCTAPIKATSTAIKITQLTSQRDLGSLAIPSTKETTMDNYLPSMRLEKAARVKGIHLTPHREPVLKTKAGDKSKRHRRSKTPRKCSL